MYTYKSLCIVSKTMNEYMLIIDYINIKNNSALQAVLDKGTLKCSGDAGSLAGRGTLRDLSNDSTGSAFTR